MKKKYQIRIEDEMKEGDYFVKNLVDDNIAVIKLANGFRVVSLTCPHMGGNIVIRKNEKKQKENEANLLTFQCNWHGYIYNIDGSFYKNPNIENTSNIRVKSKFYNPDNCVKDLQKDLSLKVIDYKFNGKMIEIEI